MAANNDLEKQFLEYYLGVGGSLNDLWVAFWEAGVAATPASTSAAEAAASAAAAAATYDSFDDRYLGPKAVDPTLDNDGAALLTGAMYFNTASSRLRIYTGTVWIESTGVSADIVAASAKTALIGTDSIGIVDSAAGNTLKETTITQLFASPQAIGSTTPSTGAFTTLSTTGDATVGGGDFTLTGTGNIFSTLQRATNSSYNVIDYKTGATEEFLVGQFPGSADWRMFTYGAGVTALTVAHATGLVTCGNGLAVTGPIAATTTLKSGGYTVATLPAGSAGMRAYITDATTPTWNAALTGGGAVVCPTFHNGTAWVSA